MTSRLHFDPIRNILALLIPVAFAAALVGCAGVGVKTGKYVDDSAITAKVKMQLLHAENLPATGIHVETVGGRVDLSGFVASKTQKHRAEIIARGVNGVRGVDNALVIQGR